MNILQVCLNKRGEIVIVHPDLQPDPSGRGYIIFTPTQARHLADLLNKYATQSETTGNPWAANQNIDNRKDP